MAIIAMATMISCKKDNKETENNNTNTITPSMTIHVENVWNGLPLYLNDTVQTLSSKIVFKTLNYYMSNFVLEDINGDFHHISSYQLLQNSNTINDLEIELFDVPSNEYVGLQMMMGVDSLKNVSGAQEGVLDPANGMFWNWNTGYIFTKFEGYYNNGTTSGDFTYHLGGFTGANAANPVVSVPFGADILSTEAGIPQLHILVDWKDFFEATTEIDCANMPTVTMPGMMAHNLSLRWHQAIHFDHVHQ